MRRSGPLEGERVSAMLTWSAPAGGGAVGIRVDAIRTGLNGKARCVADLVKGPGPSIDVGLEALDPDVHKVVFVVSASGDDDPTFGVVREAVVWLVGDSTDAPIAVYELSEEFPDARTLVLGEIIRTGSGWKYRPVGFVWDGDLATLAVGYGIDASDV